MNQPLIYLSVSTSSTTTKSLLAHRIRSLLVNNFNNNYDASFAVEPRKRKHTNVFLLDGGTGEELIANGVPYDSKIWSARAIIEDQYHVTVEKVHKSFISSGCDAITTNSYGIVPGVGFSKAEMARYCSVAGQIARNSVRNAKPHDVPKNVEADPTFVLGSLGPLVESYHADNILSRENGIEYYSVAIQALQPYVDAFIAETISSSEEAMQVLYACSSELSNHPRDSNAETDLVLLLFISFTVNYDGCLRSDENIVAAISNVLDCQESICSNVQSKYGID